MNESQTHDVELKKSHIKVHMCIIPSYKIHVNKSILCSKKLGKWMTFGEAERVYWDARDNLFLYLGTSDIRILSW